MVFNFKLCHYDVYTTQPMFDVIHVHRYLYIFIEYCSSIWVARFSIFLLNLLIGKDAVIACAMLFYFSPEVRNLPVAQTMATRPMGLVLATLSQQGKLLKQSNNFWPLSSVSLFPVLIAKAKVLYTLDVTIANGYILLATTIIGIIKNWFYHKNLLLGSVYASLSIS